MYEEMYLGNDIEMYKLTKRYRHLGGMHLNNVICTSNQILYTPIQDVRATAPVDHDLERYLVLSNMANHE